MGWGTFIAGQLISSTRRSSQEKARRHLERERNKSEWRREQDHKKFIRNIDRLFKALMPLVSLIVFVFQPVAKIRNQRAEIVKTEIKKLPNGKSIKVSTNRKGDTIFTPLD